MVQDGVGHLFKVAYNGKGLCVRAVIENLNFKYRTNDK